jgi:lactoylglutathione lyase
MTNDFYYLVVMKNIFISFLLAAAGIGSLTIQSPRTMKKPVLNHIALYVTDLKRSTAFYQHTMGLDTIPEPFHDGKHTWFSIGHQSQLHLIEGAAEPVKHPKNTHLCFSIPSVEAFMPVLDKAGISYTNWPGTSKSPTVRADGIRQIYFQDPDGYWIEVNDDYR